MKFIASHSFNVYKDLVQKLDKGDMNDLMHSSCPLFLILDDFLLRMEFSLYDSMEYSLCDSTTLDDDNLIISCKSARDNQILISLQVPKLLQITLSTTYGKVYK